MHTGNPARPRVRAGSVAVLLAVTLGSATVPAVTAHAATSRASNSVTTQPDPRYASLAKAKATAHPVAVDAMTTPDSITTAQPNGTLATTTTAQPTRMRNGGGAWRNIDPTLVRNADGTVSTTATPTKLTLSGGGTGAAITATDQAGHTMALSLPVALPAPTLSGATATYHAIYPGVDFTVTAEPSGGFSEVFTVGDAAAETKVRNLKFAVGLTGLTLRATPSGGIDATDATTGATVMSAPQAAMWDSATGAAASPNAPADFDTVTNPASSAAGPGLGAHTGPMPATISGNTLTLAADPARLDTTKPRYPLYLDPTWAEPFQSGGTINYTQAQQGCPTFKYWNNVTQPGVGYNAFDSCVGAFRSYFELNTANLNSADKIVSSTLKINEVYSAWNSCNEGSQTVAVDWTGGISSTTDWGTNGSGLPGVVKQITSKTMESVGNATGTMCSGGVLPGDFDLTSAITSIAAGNNPNITIGLVGDESGSNPSLMRFNNNPSVYTVYDIPPATPSNLAASPTPIDAAGNADQDCGGNTVGFMGISNIGGQHIATLSATLTSPVATAQMQGIFTLTDATTNTVVGNYTSAGWVTGSGNAGVQTPALTDGHQYAWSLYSSDQFFSSLRSATCRFQVDLTPPTNPVVDTSKTNFPPLGSATPGPTTGVQGTFTVNSGDPAPSGGVASGLKGFYYSFDTPVPATGAHLYAGTSGLAIPTSFGTWGVHTLYVQAVDNAGNVSAQTQYSFFVPQNTTITDTAGGNVTSDGVTDLVTTDSTGGNLAYYPAGSDPTAKPVPLSVSADSPTGDPWSDFLFTHRGNFSNNGNSTHTLSVDDLWAFDTKTGRLYLYKNNGANPFQNTANWTEITKAEITTDNGGDLNLPGPGPCFATQETNCTGYQTNSTWTGLDQLVATNDLYAADPVAGVAASVPFDLLTVENGGLWLYQANNGAPNYLVNPVQLGSPGSSDNWTNYTIAAPGPVGGKPTLWARQKNTGTVYQYTITYGPDGYPYPLALPGTTCTATVSCPTPLTIPGAGGNGTATLTAADYPQLTSPGNWSSASNPDLVATTANGELIDYPGGVPTAAGAATFIPPQPVGQPTSSGEVDFVSDGAQYPSGSTWSTANARMNFDDGVLTITDKANNAVFFTAGSAGHPSAVLVLQNDGNLVLYSDNSANHTVLWEINTGSGSPFAVKAGDSLALRADGTLALYTDPSHTNLIWSDAPGDGTLVREPTGKVALAVGGALIWFRSPTDVNQAGYGSTTATTVPDGTIDADPTTVPVDGSLVRDAANGAEAAVAGGAAIHFADNTEVTDAGDSHSTFFNISPAYYTAMATMPANGTLVKGDATSQIWQIENGQKIASTTTGGYTTVSESWLDAVG